MSWNWKSHECDVIALPTRGLESHESSMHCPGKEGERLWPPSAVAFVRAVPPGRRTGESYLGDYVKHARDLDRLQIEQTVEFGYLCQAPSKHDHLQGYPQR